MRSGIYDRRYGVNGEANYIQDASIVTENDSTSDSVIIPKGMMPYEVFNKIRSYKNMNFTGGMLSKNKYTVRGALFGGFGGMCFAMYKKRSAWGGIFIGGIAGCMIGYIWGDVMTKMESKKDNTTTK